MSEIAGIININQEPVDQGTLDRMGKVLTSKAPDGMRTWHSGRIGLAHSMLVIEPQDRACIQPFTPDGVNWICADAHIYSQTPIKEKLRSSGVLVPGDISVPGLILLAYRELGCSFVKYLIGDFAFAIWDSCHQRLICARDHLGVRPLFYSLSGTALVFGSDISALLMHPKVSRGLDEEFIADFLLFGSSIEADSTVYRHIRRLPAAHILTCDASGVQLERYWAPPLHERISYTRSSDYSEHFAALHQEAVKQRIPSTGIGLELTGGMDSSSIAAVAAPYCKELGIKMVAYTNTCHEWFPDDREGGLATRVADFLHLPIKFLACENYPLFDRFNSPALQTAEPFGNPDLAQHLDKLKDLETSGFRVLLTGQVGDALFAGSTTYFANLLMTGRFYRFASELFKHSMNLRALGGTGLMGSARKSLGKFAKTKPWQPEQPNWLNQNFARRIKYQDRWLRIWNLWNELNDAHQQLHRPWFSSVFGDYEAISHPLVVRHPFADLRLVEFMLRTPDYFHHDKRILRAAMQGRLPQEIIRRPKVGAVGDVHHSKLQLLELEAIPALNLLNPYIDVRAYLDQMKCYALTGSAKSTWTTWHFMGPIALAYWMNNNYAKEPI